MVNAILNETPMYDEDSFEDYLNELYGKVTICGFPFQQGTALKELDPIAFNCSLADNEDYTVNYTCGACDAEYDNEEDAEECCKVEDDLENDQADDEPEDLGIGRVE